MSGRCDALATPDATNRRAAAPKRHLPARAAGTIESPGARAGGRSCKGGLLPVLPDHRLAAELQTACASDFAPRVIDRRQRERDFFPAKAREIPDLPCSARPRAFGLERERKRALALAGCPSKADMRAPGDSGFRGWQRRFWPTVE